jgi:hypothetical protein
MIADGGGVGGESKNDENGNGEQEAAKVPRGRVLQIPDQHPRAHPPVGRFSRKSGRSVRNFSNFGVTTFDPFENMLTMTSPNCP